MHSMEHSRGISGFWLAISDVVPRIYVCFRLAPRHINGYELIADAIFSPTGLAA